MFWSSLANKISKELNM